MKIKSLIFLAVLATAILCVLEQPVPASAQTTSAQAKINALMQQITQLQAQLKTLQS